MSLDSMKKWLATSGVMTLPRTKLMVKGSRRREGSLAREGVSSRVEWRRGLRSRPSASPTPVSFSLYTSPARHREVCAHSPPPAATLHRHLGQDLYGARCPPAPFCRRRPSRLLLLHAFFSGARNSWLCLSRLTLLINKKELEPLAADSPSCPIIPFPSPPQPAA